MGELACLIAPRKLIVVAGKQDVGFYLKGSQDAYDTIEKIYDKAGCADKAVEWFAGGKSHWGNDDFDNKLLICSSLK